MYKSQTLDTMGFGAENYKLSELILQKELRKFSDKTGICSSKIIYLKFNLIPEKHIKV